MQHCITYSHPRNQHKKRERIPPDDGWSYFPNIPRNDIFITNFSSHNLWSARRKIKLTLACLSSRRVSFEAHRCWLLLACRCRSRLRLCWSSKWSDASQQRLRELSIHIKPKVHKHKIDTLFHNPRSRERGTCVDLIKIAFVRLAQGAAEAYQLSSNLREAPCLKAHIY